MLIDCPKCGFQQPKDQYCANCGVDIPKYLKKHKNNLTDLLKSTQVQSIIIIGITLVISYSYFKYQNDNKVKHIKENTAFMSKTLKQKNVNVATESSSAENSNSYETASEQIKVHEPSEPQKNALAPKAVAFKANRQNSRMAETNATAATSPTNSTPSSANTAASKQEEIVRLSVLFYEVPTINLNYWEQNNTQAIKTVPVNELSKLKNLKPLVQKSIELKNGASQKMTFETMPIQNQNDLGLGLDLVFKRSEGGLGEMAIRKRFHIQSEEDSAFSFSVTKGQSSYIFWPDLLSGFEHYPDLLNTAPFTILNSNHFKNNNSELIIVISIGN